MTQLIKTSTAEAEEVAKQDTLLDYWNKQFSSTYELRELPEETIHYLDSVIKPLVQGIVLDNGCGTGRIKKYFEEKDWQSYGTDLSIEALKLASKDTPVNLICTPSHSLPFKNDMFDLVISWRVLHNIPLQTRKEAVKEIGRVMKRGAKLICSVQSIEDISTIDQYKEYGVELKKDPNTYVTSLVAGNEVIQYLKHFYTKEEIIEEISLKAGLKITSVNTIVEKSGIKAINQKEQRYWLIEAIK